MGQKDEKSIRKVLPGYKNKLRSAMIINFLILVRLTQ